MEISHIIGYDVLDLIYKGITYELNKYYKYSNKKINIDYKNYKG